jgi:hypothetical protein
MTAITDADYFGPNLKALRRILAALIASAVLCFAITLTLIARAKPPQTGTRIAQKRRACPTQCARRRTR